MNWDAIGAIAELLGAIGVIASLIYLATQIRQSREQMRASTAQQFQSQVMATAQAGARDPELFQLLRRGSANIDQLDEDELGRFTIYWQGILTEYDNAYYQYRAGIYWQGILTEYDNAYYQYRAGLLDEARWQQHHSQMQYMLQTPGMIAWWKSVPIAKVFGPEFVALVEEILGEEAEGTDGAQS
jgi:hypothetical protein